MTLRGSCSQCGISVNPGAVDGAADAPWCTFDVPARNGNGKGIRARLYWCRACGPKLYDELATCGAGYPDSEVR